MPRHEYLGKRPRIPRDLRTVGGAHRADRERLAWLITLTWFLLRS